MGKHTVSTRCFLRLLAFAVLLASVSKATEMNIPYLKCDITLSKNTITPGEPLSLCLTLSNTSSGEVSVSLQDIYDVYARNADKRLESVTLKISILNSHDEEVPRRSLLCVPNSQECVLHSDLESGESITQEYPLHRRVSTFLEPGNYSVVIRSLTLSHGYMSAEYIKSVGSGARTCEMKRETFSGPTLSLQVLPYDEGRLTTVYEDLARRAYDALAKPITHWCGEDYSDIHTQVLSLLWAEGPIAVPYQINLIYSKEKGFRYWPPAIANTWDNIVRYATPEQIELVLEMARHPECIKEPDTDYSSHYTPGLAWAIHQWNATGPESIKEKTRDLVGRFPDEDPCPESMERGIWPYGK